jgi:pimeloyl-ACP methyl ester carboxylesterase
MNMPMQYVPTRAGRVAVEIAGEGAPIVLLHGGTHDRHDFDAIVPALSKKFRTIAVDWPGHGESEMPAPPSSMSVSLLCDALEDVVRAMRLPPAVLIGNSVGGTASLRLAARMPQAVRALALVDNGGVVNVTPIVKAFCWVQGRELVRRSFGMAFARHYLKKKGPERDAVLARIEAAHAKPGFVEMAAALWRSFGTPENDLWLEARGVTAPTLIVWGKHDPVIRARVEGKRTRALLPHASYAELDTGHVPFVEDPAAFLDTVLPFLESLRAADGAVASHTTG